MTTLSMIQWMSQTSRLQAFVMLSCLVILVESFIIPSHHHMHRKIVVVDFHYGEQDMSWNSTANAMNAARETVSSASTTSSLSSVTAADSESRSTRFEHTVTYSTLDQWFHLLGGMEEERTSGKFSGRSRQKTNPGGGPPTASPTTGIPESNNKPTDHWML